MCQKRESKISGSSVSHSQITKYVHPDFLSKASLRASRSTLLLNFADQNAMLLVGVVAKRQPACRCQKHP